MMKTWSNFLVSFFLFLSFHLSAVSTISISVLAVEDLLMNDSKSEEDMIKILDWIEEKSESQESLKEELLKKILNDIFNGGPDAFKRRALIVKELLKKERFKGKD